MTEDSNRLAATIAYYDRNAKTFAVETQVFWPTGRDPVVGALVASGVDEIVIRRSDPAVGEVCVHFPRAGFVMATA